jgi:hypothetical protein
MSLCFSYKVLKTRQAVIPLGGRSERPRPVIPVTLLGPASSRLVEGLLDTGADDTVFPESLAVRVGVALTTAPEGEAKGVGQAPLRVRYAEVTLRIADSGERREWRAWVGFTSAPLNRPLLGFAGFLQFFSALFLGDREAVELTVNSLYPGT